MQRAPQRPATQTGIVSALFAGPICPARTTASAFTFSTASTAARNTARTVQTFTRGAAQFARAANLDSPQSRDGPNVAMADRHAPANPTLHLAETMRAANPAITLLLQSTHLAGLVAELTSLIASPHVL